MMKSILVATLATLAAPAVAGATLLTSIDSYSGPGLDLSAYKNDVPDFTFGPIAVDGYVFTAAPGDPTIPWDPFDPDFNLYSWGGISGDGAFVGQDTVFGYGLGDNGEFFDAAVLALDSGLGTMQLLGTTGHSQLGFLLNYAPGFGSSPTIWTLDQAGNIIDAFDLGVLAPISTPGGLEEFAFRGISYDDGTEIYGMRFGGSFIVATETPAGQFTPPQEPVQGVPEPASWALLIAGFGLVGLAARRRPSTAARRTA